MSESNSYTSIYSGTQIQVLRIKDLLEQEGIPSIVQNDLNSGNLGGFLGGTPSTIRLKVRESDFDKAHELIENVSI